MEESVKKIVEICGKQIPDPREGWITLYKIINGMFIQNKSYFKYYSGSFNYGSFHVGSSEGRNTVTLLKIESNFILN